MVVSACMINNQIKMCNLLLENAECVRRWIGNLYFLFADIAIISLNLIFRVTSSINIFFIFCTRLGVNDSFFYVCSNCGNIWFNLCFYWNKNSGFHTVIVKCAKSKAWMNFEQKLCLVWLLTSYVLLQGWIRKSEPNFK